MRPGQTPSGPGPAYLERGRPAPVMKRGYTRYSALYSAVYSAALIMGASLPLAACQRDGGSAVAGADAGPSARMLRDNSDGADWPGYGRTYGEQHFSPLKAINAENVSDLGLAWSLDLPVGPSATQPIAVDGIIYLSSGLSLVRAVDAVSGKQLWEYDPQVGEVAGARMRQGWGNRGIAYWEGKVYTGTIDGRLIALDAKTGAVAWSAQTTDPADLRYITGAPRAMNGRIVIGHAGADSASVRGYVAAYDAENGKELWRFYTVPGAPANGFENDAMKAAAPTWSGEWWTKGGGGTVWNAMTYDAETDTLFIGTGNGAPWNHRVRSEGKGDNLYLCSIVALNASTGEYKWHYQVNPGETWDYNAAMDMHLAEIEVAGRKRKVLMQAPKNGFLYLIDRETGKLLAANKIAKVTWASKIDLASGKPVENPGARFPNGQDFELWPSMTGAHSTPPSSYNPDAQLMLIPLIEKGAIYNDRGIEPKKWKRTPGNAYDFAINFASEIKDPLNSTGWLLAVDPVTGKQAWKIKLDQMFNGGLMTTAGGLVFQGQLDGWFRAYNVTDGKLLWSFQTGAPIIGAPITFLRDGVQYVTVVSAMGGSASTATAIAEGKAPIDYRTAPRRLLTFRLGDKSVLTPTTPFTFKAADDPDYAKNPALAGKGAVVYGQRCFVCHGPAAISGGGAPDLRQSDIPVSFEAFSQVVRGGALKSAGMPAFEELTDTDLQAVRQYIREQAAAARTAPPARRRGSRPMAANRP